MAEGKRSTVLVLGATGMLGNAMLRFFAGTPNIVTWGSARSSSSIRPLPNDLQRRVIVGVDVENVDSLTRLFAIARPDVVINCIGLVKQLAEADDPLQAIPINSLLPHRLARLCQLARARFVHVSTDCVFSGAKGMYREEDPADAQDLYGRSKHLGEVDYPNAVTLRTSIIGHELASAHGLVGWFLTQQGPVRGFTRAIFSGLPTVELARLIRDHVLPQPEMRGLYHVSAAPIAKYELLQLIAKTYGRDNEISPDDKLVIDRSLDSTRFRQLSGFSPPAWPDLVRSMHDFG
jgi:dTDP-4-dehydrorhamnose reductase